MHLTLLRGSLVAALSVLLCACHDLDALHSGESKPRAHVNAPDVDAGEDAGEPSGDAGGGGEGSDAGVMSASDAGGDDGNDKDAEIPKAVAACAKDNGGCDTEPMAICTEGVAGGPNTCTCPLGYDTRDEGTTCVDINECETEHGGCDTLTKCTNNPGAPATCGACPAGYVVDPALRCVPSLTGLMLSIGELSPELDAKRNDYRLNLPLAAFLTTLTPIAPADATITINGVDAASGVPRQTPVLDIGSNNVTIVVSQDDRPSRTYTLDVRRGYQEAYVKAERAGHSDSFGDSIAISGDTLVIGAPLEDSNATGVGGDAANNQATDSGAAYVFVRNDGVWKQQAYLKASNTAAGDNFGTSVAISGDMLVVGAPAQGGGSGAAFVFNRNGASWSQSAYLKASNAEAQDYFGQSVSIAGDTLLVGAYGESSNAAGVNQNAADNSASASGAAYVFVHGGGFLGLGTWDQQAYLKASNTAATDFFGFSVSLSGDTAVVGAMGEHSAGTGINGDQTNTGNFGYGAAYVFVRSGETWSQQAYFKASNSEASDLFGGDVAIDGDTIVVGAAGESSSSTGVDGEQDDNDAVTSGAAYVFARDSGSWSQQAYLKASNTEGDDLFGSSIAIAGDTIAIGAIYESSNGRGAGANQSNNKAASAGAVYVFQRATDTWSQQAYLKAENAESPDWFGSGVAVSGDTIAIGANGEDGNGLNGNQANNATTESGAAYVFR